MRRLFLVLALVMTLIPATSLAAGMSVLIGAQSVSFGADIGEYYDIPPGPGIAVLVGLDLGVDVDIRVGQRKATEGGTGANVTYQWLEVGPRFRLGKGDSSVKADWFAGVGAYDLELDYLEFDTATGGFLGLGLEEVISEKYVGRFEVKGVYWWSDTFNNEAAALNFALYFGWQF